MTRPQLLYCPWPCTLKSSLILSAPGLHQPSLSSALHTCPALASPSHSMPWHLAEGQLTMGPPRPPLGSPRSPRGRRGMGSARNTRHLTPPPPSSRAGLGGLPGSPGREHSRLLPGIYCRRVIRSPGELRCPSGCSDPSRDPFILLAVLEPVPDPTIFSFSSAAPHLPTSPPLTSCP